MIDAAVVPGSFVKLHDGYVLVSSTTPSYTGPAVITDLEWCENEDAEEIRGTCIAVGVSVSDIAREWGTLATTFTGDGCSIVLVSGASAQRHKRLIGTIVVIHDHEMFAWVTATSSLW